MNAVEDVTNAVVMARNNSVVRGDAQRQTPQPLVQCAACHQEPVEPVETPCCGDVWCWRCAVERPYFIETHCVCGQPLALEDFRPAKAIKTLLRRNRGPSTPRDLSYDDVLPCPENCGVVLPAWSFEDHIRTCLQVIEPCPNGCDDRHVKRMDMADHVRDHCPLTIAPCKFGCNQVIPRKEMEDHMRNNMAAHLDQLLATVEAQNAAIAQLKALHEPERELLSAGGEAQNVEIDQLRAEAMRQRIRIDQLEHQKARVAHCGNFLMRRRRLVIMVLFLLALLALVGIPLVVKIVVAGGAMAGLHWGFKRWLRGVQMSRPPFRTTETNILFGMLCVAICFSLWPLIFLFFKL